MLIILFSWIYIALTTFLVGYAILGFIANLIEYRIRYITSYFLAGLLMVTVYAQFFSLFAGVGLVANIFLCAFCAAVVICFRRQLVDLVKDTASVFGKRKWYLPVCVFLVVLMAYGTSRGYMHFDTTLYHAQSIRWIEEYGVVPGLGNLQSRFGYNSSAFVLTALYSMRDVVGQSLHTTAGFVALLSSFMALDLGQVFTNKKIYLSDFARIGLVFYLSVIFSEMMSPASDYYAMLLLFDILILWLAEDEYQKEKGLCNPTPYGLLCILLVYAVTIKFSVAPLLLLVIKPAMMMIGKKDIRQVTVSLLCGFFTALPFVIRNVIISGWLVYPSTIIDLFPVDWKIPKEQADFDAAEIGVYGKGMTDATLKDTPFWEWFPPWFEKLKSLEKVFFLMTVLAIVVGVAYVVYTLVNKRKESYPFAFVFSVFTVSAFFWFLSAPLIRYGYAYVVALPLITFGYFFLSFIGGKHIEPHGVKLHQAFAVVLILFLLTRVKGLWEDITRTYKQPYYLTQMDYVDGEAVAQMVDGVTFFVPTDRALIGYHKFPASLLVWPIELRGDSIEDGFRQIDEWK